MPTHIETLMIGSQAVTVDVFLPRPTRTHPACLILHGSFGLLPQYRADIMSFGDALAERGIVATLPHYFESTGTEAGLAAFAALQTNLPAWIAACEGAFTLTANLPQVDSGRLGIIGFSLGGHIALTLGMAPPRGTPPKCVVDFFGPTLHPPLSGPLAALPPLLIHHGEKDDIVPLAESLHLMSELGKAGRTEGTDYTLTRYPTQGHGFAGDDLDLARQQTVDFVSDLLV